MHRSRITRLAQLERSMNIATMSEVESPGTLHIYTDSEGGTFDPSWTFSDASVMTLNWGDQTAKQSHATTLSHTYAAGSGRKLVRFNCSDWTKLTQFHTDADVCRLALPSFATCTLLEVLNIPDNEYSGTLPSMATCVPLRYFDISINQFNGTLPSFAACNLLESLFIRSNSFTGILPNFATCTKLTGFLAHWNQFSGYTGGGFATQKDLASINLLDNILTEASVDSILADCVTSLAIPARVVCTLNLGGTNSAPSAAGVANHLTLEAAGWTVTIS